MLKLYAMSCGFLHCRRSIFVPSIDKNIFMDSPIPVFLITHPKGNVLVDTGVNPAVFTDAAKYWGGLAKVFQPIGNEDSGVVVQLKKIGYEPKDIKYVVNTHLHFDHAGGNRFFPKSTFLVQARELECARNPENSEKGFIRADWDDDSLQYSEINGEMDIYKDGSLTIIPMVGHTPGHQVLLVRLKNSRSIVLSGDSVPCEENFMESVTTRTNMNNDEALLSIKRLHKLVEEEGSQIIYGHDRFQWENIKIAPDYYD